LLFKRKSNQLKIDLGDLQNEQEKLVAYLQTHYKIDTATDKHGLTINTTGTSLTDLKKAVNKFIYHQKLNSTHWISLEPDCVKINKFNTKKSKTKKQKKTAQPASITQTWGLG
jgi:acyl-CoA thioesterase